MKKKSLIFLLFILPLIAVGVYAYQYKGAVKIQTAESPEEVVKRFYAFIGEGGPSSLDEAYRLLNTGKFAISEDRFKNIVTNYPKDLRVNVIKGKVDEGQAVVPIEYKVASSFGGDYTVKSDVILNLDENAKSWLIDFRGDSYESGGEG